MTGVLTNGVEVVADAVPLSAHALRPRWRLILVGLVLVLLPPMRTLSNGGPTVGVVSALGSVVTAIGLLALPFRRHPELLRRRAVLLSTIVFGWVTFGWSWSSPSLRPLTFVVAMVATPVALVLGSALARRVALAISATEAARRWRLVTIAAVAMVVFTTLYGLVVCAATDPSPDARWRGGLVSPLNGRAVVDGGWGMLANGVAVLALGSALVVLVLGIRAADATSSALRRPSP